MPTQSLPSSSSSNSSIFWKVARPASGPLVASAVSVMRLQAAWRALRFASPTSGHGTGQVRVGVGLGRRIAARQAALHERQAREACDRGGQLGGEVGQLPVRGADGGIQRLGGPALDGDHHAARGDAGTLGERTARHLLDDALGIRLVAREQDRLAGRLDHRMNVEPPPRLPHEAGADPVDKLGGADVVAQAVGLKDGALVAGRLDQHDMTV